MANLEFWLAIALGAAIILGALALIALVNAARARSQPTNPTLDAILNALTPYLYRAIIAGERAVLWGMDGLDAQIQATDKKAVADSVYSLLPDVIVVDNVPLPISAVKALIPRETFERWVKNAY